MATVRWEGKAIAVAEVQTITVNDTWATNDTATLTINGKTLTLTVGTTATNATVAEALAKMINGESLPTGYSASETGDQVAEFLEVNAAESGSDCVITHGTKGVPFTLTVGETTAGDGTLSIATTTAATGPNHANNTVNWDGGSLPTDDDDVVFDDGSVDVLYALDALSAVTPESITVEMGYTGRIGLPLVNANGYPEYRDRYLQICDSTPSSGTTQVNVGGGTGSGSTRLFFQFGGSSKVAINVIDTGSPESTDTPTLAFVGGGTASTLTITKGSVGAAVIAGEVVDLANIAVSYATNQSSDSTLVLGPGVDFNSTTITQNGGSITNEATDTLPDLDVFAGEFTHRGGAVTAATVEGGTLYYESDSTLTTLIVGSDGTADFSRDLRAKTVTNCDVFEDATINDPASVVTFTNGIDVNHCTLQDVSIVRSPDFNVAFSATS